MTDMTDRALTLALSQNAAGDYQTAIYNLVVAVRSLAEPPGPSLEPTASGRAVGINDDGDLILDPSPEPDSTGRTATQADPPEPLAPIRAVGIATLS